MIVDVTPDSATWEFEDANGYVQGGTGDAVHLDIPTGTVDFTWQPLSGYESPTPSSNSQTLLEGNTVVSQETYTP